MKIKLNLLSIHRKEAIRESKTLMAILKWGAGVLGVLLIFFLLLLNIGYILKNNLNSMDSRYEKKGLESKYTEIERYNLATKQINSKLSEIENIQKEQIYWSKLFLKLNNILNSDIILSDFSNNDTVAFIVGKAKTREALVSLKNELEKEICFQDVKLPLSNLVSKNNIDFQIEFGIKLECIREI